MSRPLASLSLDLDDLWSYQKTRGFHVEEPLLTFLPIVVPRLMELMASLDLKITVFVVGRDAVRPKVRPLLRMISDAGHELANHSFHHEPWLHLYSPEQIRREVIDTELAVAEATGERTVGFRGPGFSVTEQLRELLVERGYHYDASANPNLLSPLARILYYRGVRLTEEQQRQRRGLNGGWRAAFGANRPYIHVTEKGTIPVVPVNTLPLVRLPIHVSYLHALGAYSPGLARFYSVASLRLLQRHNLSLLLHPTDLLGEEDNVPMEFFPGMQLPRSRKLAFVKEVLTRTSDIYRIVTLREHVASIAARSHFITTTP